MNRLAIIQKRCESVGWVEERSPTSPTEKKFTTESTESTEIRKRIVLLCALCGFARSILLAANFADPKRILARGAFQVITVCGLLYGCLLLTSTARADVGETLEQAITAYTQAQETTGREDRIAGFQTAERLFQHAVAQGAETADLYANLGNAALQSERLGLAILAYRRALALDPNHPRAQQNLRHARTLLPAWVPRPEQQDALESFFFWRSVLSPAEQAGVAAIAFLLATLLLAVAIRWHSNLARFLAAMPLLVWLGLLVSVTIEARGKQGGQAVLTADETIARAADSTNAQIRFGEALPGGAEVDIRETRERWVHIVLANGRDAWVPRGSVEAVRAAENGSR